MKKLVTLALAGICALAFAATADAASAIRMKAPTVKRGTTTTVGTAKVQVNRVETAYSVYAVNDGTKASQGGYFIVNSIWTDNLLNSQTVYDDIKSSLNKLGSQYSNLFPAVAQEATYVHAAQISSGNAKYNMTTQAAGSGYASVYNIAHYVIPGRVASLAQGTTEIDMSTENAPNNAPAATPTNAKTFESQEAADRWVAEVQNAFNNQEAENAQSVAAKVSELSAIYNSFLADQAKTLAAAQKVYDDAVAARETAQSAYDAAVATREAKSDDYNSKKDVSAFKNALTNATNDQNAKQDAYDAKVAAREAAERALAAALQAEADALKALNEAKAEQEAADADYQAKVAAREGKVGEAATALQAEKDAKAVLDNATVAQKAAQSNYDAKVAAREAAEEVLKTAQAEEATAKTALDKATTDKKAAQKALDEATQAIAAFDRAMAEEGLADILSTAREEAKEAESAVEEALEAYEAAQQPTITTVTEEVTQPVLDEDGNPVVDEEGNPVTQVVQVEKQVETPADEAVVAAALVTYNDAVQAKTDADEAYEKARADYEKGIAALDDREAALDKAKGDAQLALDDAIGVENTAQADYNAKVAAKDAKAAELAEAQEAEDAALVALNEAKDATAAADADYKAKVAAREAKDGEVVDAQAAEADALAALNAANGVQATAQADYDAKVADRKVKNGELADAQALEDSALDRLNTAIANREAAEQALANARQARADALAAFNNAKDAEASALAFLNNKKSEEADALAALEALKVKQANDNAAKLAQLKNQITTHINGLKYIDDQTGIYGLNYNVNMIDGYDSMRFDEVAYQRNSFTAPEYSLESANKKDDKAIESVVSISYSAPKVAMVDGVLTEVSYVNTGIYETSIYFQSGQKYISPLVLDITGNGKLQASNGQNMPGHDIVASNNIIGDFFGDGFEIAMEWVGPQDGLLVAPNADGSVDMSCLFGTAGGYETGYEKLSLYDKNEDMKVSGEELNDLAIWQDANGNGIADAGEVKSVKSLGITSINVAFNRENYVSSFERNGQTYKMWDWWPNATELIKVAAK